eukprot:CAMPEP_0197451092 /NCGR_PEP_ID=MMETSP1175-20131217/27652_1 /TAXON_ID=1003142 /ORGANISM="Triceratium dubium, Strain CCMP147" /LENGTH=224 /DNA_ID=CAMNT_0042983701 /DNA_START=383 /DNA_END=1057 /DNA_ORIENTATION=+
MIRILIIKPGFGGGKDGTRYKILCENPDTDVSMPDVPEPAPGKEITTGLQILRNEIERFHPDVLIAASRGGIYVTELASEGFTKIPIFCISALKTRMLCAANDGTCLLMMCHGTKDDKNPIERVRCDCMTSNVAELVEFDDGHKLSALENSGQLLLLLNRLLRRGRHSDAYSLWVEEERPRWIESQLEPRIREDEKRAREDRERILHLRRGQDVSSVLSELKSK